MPTPTATVMIPYHALDELIQRGTRAAQPAAAAVTPGTLYSVTDEGDVLERSNGITWQAYAPSGDVTLPPYYDYGEGTPANPPADTIRLYAVDDSGFSFLEERDSAGRIIRTSRDTVAVGKVDEAGGIVRGQCVYVSGAAGANRLLKKALATSRSTTPAFGVAMESGAQNAFIRVLTSGLLGGLDTSAVAEGTRVFLSATTPGEVTVTPPVAPNLIQRVGWVLRQHGTQGEVGVLPATALSEASWVATHASMHEPGGRDPLTALDAGVVTSGTLADARLSAQVARRDQANTFTNPQQQIDGAYASLFLSHSPGPADARQFGITSDGTGLYITARSDAYATQTDILVLSRNGNVFIGANAYEQGRAVPMGHWQDVPFNAANFTAGPPMFWTVTGSNVTHNRYTLIGKTLIWTVYIVQSVLSGTSSGTLYLGLPAGLTTNMGLGVTTQLYDGAYRHGLITTEPNRIAIQQYPPANYTINTNTYVLFTMTLEIQ